MLLALMRHGDRHRRPAVGGRAARRSRRRSSAAAPAARRVAAASALRPGPRAPRRAARPRAAASCVNEEEWAMYRDLGFIRVWGGCAGGPARARHAPRPAAARRTPTSIYPHKPIVAYLPQTARAAQRVLRRVPGRDAALRQRAAAGLRRRAGQVDGAHRRRAAPDRQRQHAPARPPGRPASRSAATSGACGQWERERLRRAPRRAAPAPSGASRARLASASVRRREHDTASTSSTAPAPLTGGPVTAPPRAPT